MINEDPFSYFISPAEDRDVYFESDLAAGIRNDRKSRSLSPFHHKARKNISSVSTSATMKLRNWIERMEKQYFRRGSDPIVAIPKSCKAPGTTSPPMRGRGDHRTSSSLRVTHNLRSPPRRPKVWQEPSVDIWPVLEEAEDVGLGINMQ